MKQIVKVMCLAAMMISAGMSTQAQFRQSVFLNGMLPVGNWATDIKTANVPLKYTEVGKDAIIGFGLGYRASYRFNVGLGEVAPFVGVDAFWNMISSEWRTKYLDANSKAPSYINMPIMAGVSYFYNQLWNDITPYGEFAVGTDVMFITPEGAGKVNGIPFKKYAYKPSTDLAWMIGAGAYFGRHVSAGIYYYGLGTHTIDYTKNTLKDNEVANAQMQTAELNNAARQKRAVGAIGLRLGFHF